MLLLQMLMFTLVDFSSSYEYPTRCYGSTYSFSTPQMPNSIFYMPQTHNERILVVEKGKSKHERFEVTSRGVSIKDLTDEDDQAILFFDQQKSIQLKIDDCKDPQKTKYGGEFFWKVPSFAKYLQFSQVVPYKSTLKPVVIWNRTHPSLHRGSVKEGYYELKKAKQTNSGYYKFRGSRNQLLKWRRLEVEEVDFHFEVTEGEMVEQELPPGFLFQHILYTPEGSTEELLIEKIYMSGRMSVYDEYFSIFGIVQSDSGIYKFVDEEGNVAARVQLEVMNEIPTWGYFVFAVAIIIGIIICCCCVKKCCCKKDKRNIPVSTTAQSAAAAPAVFYHESNQSAPPAIPLLSREPTNVVGSMDPPQFTQATIPAGPGPTSGTNADIEPKFVVKGSFFPSALPLSADSSIQDVYTSDKLNFL